MKAVDYPELHQWVDIIVFSTKGPRSPMSLLGGGDYDGDTVIVMWEPTIVDAFQNAPLTPHGLCPADPPENFMADNFIKSSQLLETLLSTSPPDALESNLQQALLAPLEHETVVGQYSVM